MEQGYRKVLVATDFSPHAQAAFKQAIWLARQSGAKITLAHTLPDFRKLVLSASHQAKADLFYGDGGIFQREVRQQSDTRMRNLVTEMNATDLDVQVETLLGEPYLQITHAVQAENHELVIVGTRGRSPWEQLFVGSTAKRLIRNCPASVLIVKEEHAGPPKVILAATDFSDVSRKAVVQGLQLARLSGAAFHLLHVIDSGDVPDDMLEMVPEGGSLRQEINDEATKRLDEFVESLHEVSTPIHRHLSWGTPSRELTGTAKNLAADLIVMGTVGRSGITGMLLGNTAETVLDTCDCSILTVKPDDFVSPIEPPFWRLHPEPEVEKP
jgi:universal stress protein E